MQPMAVVAGHTCACSPPLRSSHFCTGACCAPLSRNRSCHFRRLLFRPPNVFAYIHNEAEEQEEAGQPKHTISPPAAARFTTVKRSIFFSPTFKPLAGAEGSASLSGEHFTPELTSADNASGVRRCVTTPLYIGGSLHWNIGHGMLDMVFPGEGFNRCGPLC